MKKLKIYGLDLCHVTMAAWSRTSKIHVCDIVTSEILAGPLKMIEQSRTSTENIEKKVDIFHSLNDILAKARNQISKKKKKQAIWFSCQ